MLARATEPCFENPCVDGSIPPWPPKQVERHLRVAFLFSVTGYLIRCSRPATSGPTLYSDPTEISMKAVLAVCSGTYAMVKSTSASSHFPQLQVYARVFSRHAVDRSGPRRDPMATMTPAAISALS